MDKVGDVKININMIAEEERKEILKKLETLKKNLEEYDIFGFDRRRTSFRECFIATIALFTGPCAEGEDNSKSELALLIISFACVILGITRELLEETNNDDDGYDDGSEIKIDDLMRVISMQDEQLSEKLLMEFGTFLEFLLTRRFFTRRLTPEDWCYPRSMVNAFNFFNVGYLKIRI